MLLVLGAIIILIIYPVLPSAKLYSAMLQAKRVPGAMSWPDVSPSKRMKEEAVPLFNH